MSSNRSSPHETRLRQQAEAAAKMASMPVRNPHAAGIDVGDQTHWVCVEHTPDARIRSANSPPTRRACAI